MSIHLPHDHGHLSDDIEIKIQDDTTFHTISDIFKMMSDDTRVRIFWLLCHCEERVINISALLNMSSPAVSHHLKLLRDSGLVISRRCGKEVYYTAAKTSRSEALHRAIEDIIEVACPTEVIFKESQSYDSQIQIINDIHELLISNIAERYTVEQLSARFAVNATTLKATFKKVYGKPIAAYMKDQRMTHAMELLRTTDTPISEIARLVGYESAGKFSEAFKNITGRLPKDYRHEIT